MRRRPYAGPPDYRAGHPTWGFPPVIWRNATVTGRAAGQVPAQVRGLLPVAALAALTALACATSAAAEAWRFTLLLSGRTQVLPGGPVRASDVLVLASGMTALALGVITALAALPVLTTLHRSSAQRSSHAPSRSAAALLARLVLPGWNLYGAGQVVMEIDRQLREVDGRRRSTRVTAPLWWVAWAVNGALVLATLLMAFGSSNQWVADTVQMHVAVELVGAVVAGLFAAVLVSFERSWVGRGSGAYHGWSVGRPESTAGNRTVGGDGAGEASVGDGETDSPVGGELPDPDVDVASEPR